MIYCEPRLFMRGCGMVGLSMSSSIMDGSLYSLLVDPDGISNLSLVWRKFENNHFLPTNLICHPS